MSNGNDCIACGEPQHVMSANSLQRKPRCAADVGLLFKQRHENLQ